MFRDFYQACIGIVFDKIDLETKEPEGAAEITLEYKLNKAPGTVKVEYISKDNKYYYPVKDGVYTNTLVEKSSVKEGEGSLFTMTKEVKEYIKKIK